MRKRRSRRRRTRVRTMTIKSTRMRMRRRRGWRKTRRMTAITIMIRITIEKKGEKNHNNNDSDVDNDVKRNADNNSDDDTNSCVSASRSSWGSTVVTSIYTDDLATMGSCPQQRKSVIAGACLEISCFPYRRVIRNNKVSLTLLARLCDWFLISPYNIIPESSIQVVRLQEMITN